MTIFAIGDVQGSFDELQGLLSKCRFDRSADTLWFVGDLVNRGPKSLEVLRFVRDLGSAARVVLGNHDLHLLSVAEGCARLRDDDTLDEVLAASDRDVLLGWLRGQPLMYVENGFAMVHAGLLPQWSVARASSLAREVEAALRGPKYRDFFVHLYGSQPARWDDRLTGWDRLRVIVNVMTRMRFCALDGTMEFAIKGETASAPPGFLPWFEVPGRRHADHTVVCGHWSALGLHIRPDVLAIDSGCVWGGALTALRLHDRAVFQVSCGAQEHRGSAR